MIEPSKFSIKGVTLDPYHRTENLLDIRAGNAEIEGNGRLTLSYGNEDVSPSKIDCGMDLRVKVAPRKENVNMTVNKYNYFKKLDLDIDEKTQGVTFEMVQAEEVELNYKNSRSEIEKEGAGFELKMADVNINQLLKSLEMKVEGTLILEKVPCLEVDRNIINYAGYNRFVNSQIETFEGQFCGKNDFERCNMRNCVGFENPNVSRVIKDGNNREGVTRSLILEECNFSKCTDLEIVHKNDNPAFDYSDFTLKNDVFTDEVSLKLTIEENGRKIASERNEYSGLDNKIRSIKGEVIISGSFIKNNNSIVDSKVTDSTLDCCNIKNVESVIYYSGFGETVRDLAQLTGGENNARDVFRKYTKAKVIDDKKCGDLEL